jgi:hypothetical protein
LQRKGQVAEAKQEFQRAGDLDPHLKPQHP